MGRVFLVDLEGKTYNCKFCKTQLARAGQLISKALHCSSGRAYLFNKVEKSHEESQKYKEGKFVLERVRIIDGEFDSEFYIDTRSSSSDDEDRM